MDKISFLVGIFILIILRDPFWIDNLWFLILLPLGVILLVTPLLDEFYSWRSENG